MSVPRFDTGRFGGCLGACRGIGSGEEEEARSRRHIVDGITPHVEAIGSSSVLGLLAKPIIDLAVGLASDQPLDPIAATLGRDGWIYRGDAGPDGGHVFVLEDRPWHRVAHLHVVTYGGDSWRNYLRLRDLFRSSPDARRSYEAVKSALAEREPVDRKAYTIGKTEIVEALLSWT